MAMRETFEHAGKLWRRLPAETAERFIVGLDIGQSQDPSALCVIHYRRTPLETWTPKEGEFGGTLRQACEERYDCVHLERLPLGQSYVDQIAYVQEVLARPPLNGLADFVLDQSGCGAPVGDLFHNAGMKPIRIIITAGAEAQLLRHRQWSVPKQVLISNLDAKLHCGKLKIAKQLIEASALREELAEFRRHVTQAGRTTFQARVGRHDDLVLAVAIALWWCDQAPRMKVSTGTVIGLV